MSLNDNGKIYTQHEQAFRGVKAYVVLDASGGLVARVAFNYARSGLRPTESD